MMLVKFIIFATFLNLSLADYTIPKIDEKSFSLQFSDIQKAIKNAQKGIKNVQKVVKTSQKVVKIITKISTSASSTRQGENMYETYEMCNVCQSVMDEFMFMRRVEKFEDKELIEMAIELCELFEIQPERVCRGLIEYNAPSILHIVDNREELTPDIACQFLLNAGECAKPIEDKKLNFTINIDEYDESSEKILKPTYLQHAEDLVIVHLTDIHVDFKYKEGALAACKEYACCRNFEEVDEMNLTHLAGFWGDYRGCDTPWHAIEDAFNQIMKQHEKIDYIYFTGDVVDHFIFDTDVDDMKKSMTEIYELMKKSFGNIPIYSIIGNHEAQNLFAPIHVEGEKLSTQWLYDHFTNLWYSDFTLTKDFQQTLRDGGYYTIRLRPGLRLIAINNNVCYYFNWWILYGVEQIREQFQWLHDILLDAEQSGDKVHILAHIPSNIEEFYGPCSREYRRIIDRFHKTIVAQFNGHTEVYGFHLYYQENNLTNPISIGFNGGSIASYSYQNRNYVVYGVDGRNFEVKDVDIWTYNLTAANVQGELESPTWIHQSSLREDFNLTDLSPQSMNNFVHQMLQDPVVFDKFWKLQIKNSDYMLAKGCNKNCMHDTICNIVSSDNTHQSVCNSLFQQLKE